MSSDFRQEIEHRRKERRRQRSNTWTNLIIRIIALIFVILVIRYFGTLKEKQLKTFFPKTTADSIQVIFPEVEFDKRSSED